MELKIGNIKKVFYTFLFIGMVLIGLITYLYYFINVKSAKMLQHRTFVTKNISYIKYHSAQTHLWLMEYVSGDTLEKEKIYIELQNIDIKLQKLIDFEKNKLNTVYSKFRDTQAIYDKFLDLEKEYKNLTNLIDIHIKENFKAGSEFDINFDKSYQNFINNITRLEKYLDKTFVNVNNEFTQLKHKVYILIFIMTIISFLASYIIMKNQINKIKIILEQEKKLKIQSQNKITSISNILSNIAHQWRQPLSAISTTASSLQLKLAIDDEINKKELNNGFQTIMDKTRNLSNIIDDFKSFFANEESLNRKKEFDIKITIDKIITDLEDTLQKENIQLIYNIDNFMINNNETQFKQVIINILKNSIEALQIIEEKNNKYIFIKGEATNENNYLLNIKDSACGLNKDQLEQIYEPYFTTKHQSQGTGLGLYFVYEVITKYFNGKIESENINFTYEDKNLKGLNTAITLPR